MNCGAPCPGTEVTCQREQGHSGECYSKYKIFYEHGIVSTGQMWWVGPHNLDSQKENHGDANHQTAS